MSKQRRNYNMARVRPTSYSHIHTNQQIDKLEINNRKFFSNLLHNYEKIGKTDDQVPKLTLLRLRKGDSCKINPVEVELKQLQPKFPFQSPFFTQRSSFQSERQRLSNYSLYLQRSFSRKSRRSSLKFDISNRIPVQMSKSELIEPCKITPIKIGIRRVGSDIIKDKESADIIRKRNGRKIKTGSDVNISKKIGEEMIEPWCPKNYESIML